MSEVERDSTRFNVTYSKNKSNTALEDPKASGEIPETPLLFLAICFGKGRLMKHNQVS